MLAPVAQRSEGVDLPAFCFHPFALASLPPAQQSAARLHLHTDDLLETRSNPSAPLFVVEARPARLCQPVRAGRGGRRPRRICKGLAPSSSGERSASRGISRHREPSSSLERLGDRVSTWMNGPERSIDFEGSTCDELAEGKEMTSFSRVRPVGFSLPSGLSAVAGLDASLPSRSSVLRRRLLLSRSAALGFHPRSSLADSGFPPLSPVKPPVDRLEEAQALLLRASLVSATHPLRRGVSGSEPCKSWSLVEALVDL